MVHKELMLSDLFKQFIKESYSGKRLKQDGKKIRPQTVDNYKAVQFLLTEFENHTGTTIRIKLITGNNKKELLTERRYWNKFYLNFTTFLYNQKGCYDNYVGTVIKIIRIFFKEFIAGRYFTHCARLRGRKNSFGVEKGGVDKWDSREGGRKDAGRRQGGRKGCEKVRIKN